MGIEDNLLRENKNFKVVVFNVGDIYFIFLPVFYMNLCHDSYEQHTQEYIEHILLKKNILVKLSFLFRVIYFDFSRKFIFLNLMMMNIFNELNKTKKNEKWKIIIIIIIIRYVIVIRIFISKRFYDDDDDKIYFWHFYSSDH